MLDKVKAVFRDPNSRIHLLGPMLFPFAIYAVALYPEVAQIIVIAILFMAPHLWEVWDKYKVLYDDPRALDWSSLKRQIFTSEGEYDNQDALLGYLGMGVGFVLLALLKAVL